MTQIIEFEKRKEEIAARLSFVAYRYLWAMVILQSLKDVANSSSNRNITIQNHISAERSAAFHWFITEDYENFNSFANICDGYRFNKNKIRQIAVKAYETRELPEALQKYMFNKFGHGRTKIERVAM